MKKYFVFIFIILISFTLSVHAFNNSFSFDSTKLIFTSNSKKNEVIGSFNKEYNLTHSISNEKSDLEEKIEVLTKKTTYLLLGDFNNNIESSEDYYKRHSEYLNLRYNPKVLKDENSLTGLDENSQEYKDDLVSGLTVPSFFNQINELGIIYNSYGDIKVTITDNLVISSVALPNIKIKSQNKDNPMKYDYENTNLVLYYYFKKLGDEYKLYYLFGETKDNINKYLSELQNSESKNIASITSSYESNLSAIYNFDKLKSMSDNEFNRIYNSNITNIVYLSSYYNNKVVSNANGFFINDGIIVTTWDFLEKALITSQYITINDSNGKNYEIDGIITANIASNVVVIKLKNKNGTYVKLGEASKLSIEDPAITISSKLGTGLIIQKGIVVANNDYIETSIPLGLSDTGSPLFDKSGNVVGINTSKNINTSISMAINSKVLKEIQDKFNNINFESIETITFEKLKEDYYYVKFNEENIKNSIPKSKWNIYSKIGNIEDNIKLELIKASYKNKIVSLRYKNNISKYIQSMQLASSFKEKLITDGYKEVLDSSSKCIYENKNYQVIIMDEFDYLIIVMVKK